MSQSADPRFTTPQLTDGRRATRAYADLMFAYGFVRLGDSATAEQLRSDAARDLDAIETNREFHRLARLAFECRIAEALRGEPHAGTLDDRCPEVIAALLLDDFDTKANSEPGLIAYQLGRLVQFSVILEPERNPNPLHRFLVPQGIASQAWAPMNPPSADWSRQLSTDASPEAIWQALRPTEAEAMKRRGAQWREEVRNTSVQRLPGLLIALGSFPLSAVQRVLSAVVSELPPVVNAFTTAPYFSRMHFAVVDALVLAVAGTGPLPPQAERPERLELLASVRPPVLAWIDAMPVTKS